MINSVAVEIKNQIGRAFFFMNMSLRLLEGMNRYDLDSLVRFQIPLVAAT